ncbi:MAG TPA: hypothetical protein VE987_03200 [Polyangiaceae bacterium]|nr:hypothetical protein [Polyangiaceae bacterium]
MSRAAIADAISLAWGLVVSVGVYAAVRCVQFFVYPDPNPAAPAWSAHAGYFWRVWTVAYAGGMAAFVVRLVARGHVEAAARGLVAAVYAAAVLLGLQVVFFP